MVYGHQTWQCGDGKGILPMKLYNPLITASLEVT